MDDNEAFAGGLAYRLAMASTVALHLEKLHAETCLYIGHAGVALCRSTLGLELLHPEERGTQFVWTGAGSHIFRNLRADVAKSGSYLNSPVRVVDETGSFFRKRLDGPIKDIPFLEELRSKGASDYVIFPLPFQDRSRTCIASFATKSDGGFSDNQIRKLELASIMLSPYAERFVLRRIAVDLLDTYVGHRSGERIFSGEIQRGATELIEAATLMIDLRHFTRFSDEHPIITVVSTLNAFFEEIVVAVENHGGEVLKFIGDGLLAIFPGEPSKVTPACQKALAAAREALDRLHHLNHSRREEGEPPLTIGLALHVGEVAYGNIGGRLRLDFTAIGPAVNHTSRLLELAKRLDVTTAVSASFERACGATLPSLGFHELRDVDDDQLIFSIQ